jgi:hypothetical protein
VGFPQAQTMTTFPRAAFDVFDLDEMLTPEERDLRYRVRGFAVSLSDALVLFRFLQLGEGFSRPE